MAASTRDSSIATGVLVALVEVLEDAGIPRAEFLLGSCLDLATLESPDSRMPRAELHRLGELALDRTGNDPALALHWGERLSERGFVLISPLLTHCSSLRQAFELLAQFAPLLADEANYEVEERDGEVVLRWLPVAGLPTRLERLTSEMMVAGFYRLVRSFGADASPHRVLVAYPPPTDLTEYERFFEGTVRYDQPFTGIVFARDLLERPPRQKDDDVRDALQKVAERRLFRLAKTTSYATRVRDFLVREGFPHRTDMRSVAAALELSVRTLRRRLDEEGRAFNDLQSEALALLAKHRLADPRKTIQEVAYEMGFADASAFHRAFKRWTGTTPSVHREGLLK